MTLAQALQLIKLKRRLGRFNKFLVLASLHMDTILGDECVPIKNFILNIVGMDETVTVSSAPIILTIRYGKQCHSFFSHCKKFFLVPSWLSSCICLA